MNTIIIGKLSRTPVKLLNFVTGFYGGGTEGQVLQLGRTLDRHRFTMQFATLRKDGDLLPAYQALEAPITEFRIRNLHSPQTFLQMIRFARHLRREKTEIMHSYNFYSNVFAIPAARLANVPVVLASIRDRGVYMTSAQKLLQKWVCRLADRILVNADSIRDWLLEQGYEAHKIVVIKNGIDLSLYDKTVQRPGVRAQLGIPPRVPLVVMMSRLNKQKGVEDFIRAAALINQSHPDVWFLVVGGKLQYTDDVFSEDTAYLASLKQLTHELGLGHRVVFAGHRSDTPAILSCVDISVLPSHSEGLSNTLLESMAAGLPVVATNVGGSPELVKDGINGLLVPPKAPGPLARAVMKILEHPLLAQEFRRQALKIASENFSLAKMTADTQALYDAELERQRPALTYGTAAR